MLQISSKTMLKIQKHLPWELGEILTGASQWSWKVRTSCSDSVPAVLICMILCLHILCIVCGYELSPVHFGDPFVCWHLSYVTYWRVLSAVSVTNHAMFLLLTHICPLSFGRISPPPFLCWTCSTWLVTLLVGVSTWRRTTSFTGRWTRLCQHRHDLHTGQHRLVMPCLIRLCPAALWWLDTFKQGR